MKLKVIPVGDIKVAKYNPRKDLKPSDPEYKALERSLKEFGTVAPLVWNERTGNLVGGHQRFKILLAQKKTDIQVSVVDLDEKREKALNVALNKISGAWDFPKLKEMLADMDDGTFDLTLLGFSTDELASMIDLKGVGEAGLGNIEDVDRNFQQMTFVLSEAQAEVVKRAVAQAIDSGYAEGEDNDNKNGNAIYGICKEYLG